MGMTEFKFHEEDDENEQRGPEAKWIKHWRVSINSAALRLVLVIALITIINLCVW